MTDPLDKLIVDVARRQHPNITRQRLLELGLTDRAIARRVRHGWLHRVHQGVYALGTPPLRLDSGLLTVRLTWHRMIYTPVKEARRLGRILQRRRTGG